MKNMTQSGKINLLFAVIVVSLLGSTLLVNSIMLRLSERFNLHFDLTAGASYEIGSDSKMFLASIDVPVQIYVLSDESKFSNDRYLMQAKRIIDQYPFYSGNITLEYIDYASNPTFAVNFSEFTLSFGDIIIKSDSGSRHIVHTNLFYFSTEADGSYSIISSRAEEALTSAIMSLVNDNIINIQPKALVGSALDITESQASSIRIVIVILIPLAVLAPGIIFWLYKRYR